MHFLLLFPDHHSKTVPHNFSSFVSAQAILASVFLSFDPKQPTTLILSILVFPQINQIYSISILYHCQGNITFVSLDGRFFAAHLGY